MGSVYIPDFSEMLAVSHSRGADSEVPELWDDLVGLWPMAEAGGLTASDLSGFSNDGTLENMDPATAWVPSPYGWALDFDGVNGRVDCGIIKPAISTYSQLSVAAWFKMVNQNDTAGRIISIQYSGSDDIRVFWNAGTLFFSLDDGTVSQVSTSLAVDGKWHYVVGTYDGVTIRLYLDGKEVGTPVSDNFNFVGVGGTLFIGRDVGGTSYFTGPVNNVTIYRRARNSSEIQDLYNTPNALLQPRSRIPALPTVGITARPSYVIGGGIAV